VARVEELVLHGLDRGNPPRPSALLFLLRRYLISDRAEIADRLGHGLAVALAQHRDAATTVDRADWLRLFVEAARASDDDRIAAAIATLVEMLSSEWTTHGDIERAGASIDACLQAADCAGVPDLVQRAVDELERIVALAYRPGEALGTVAQNVRLGAALLTAFALTARLPYAMLAEELVVATRRTAWDDAAGLFSASIHLNCEAARVLDRLAVLHRDADYRAAAVLAPDANYARDAGGILENLASHISDEGFPCGVYGLALIEHMQ
jgi:hypothetical protein